MDQVYYSTQSDADLGGCLNRDDEICSTKLAEPPRGALGLNPGAGRCKKKSKWLQTVVSLRSFSLLLPMDY